MKNGLLWKLSLAVWVCLASCIGAAQQSTTGPEAVGAASAVPRLINYSGALRDAGGKPLSGVTGVTFLLYKDEQGGAPVWMETQNVTADKSGRYTVTLGATTSEGLPAEVFANGEARWLGVQVVGQAEQPRVLLVAVPYALKAVDAETLGGKPASAYVTTEMQGTSSPLSQRNVVATSASPQSTSQNLGRPQQAVANGSSAVASIGGSGTTNFIPIWTGSTTLGNSALFQTGTGTGAKIGLGTKAPTATLDIRGSENIVGFEKITGSESVSGNFFGTPIITTNQAGQGIAIEGQSPLTFTGSFPPIGVVGSGYIGVIGSGSGTGGSFGATSGSGGIGVSAGGGSASGSSAVGGVGVTALGGGVSGSTVAAGSGAVVTGGSCTSTPPEQPCFGGDGIVAKAGTGQMTHSFAGLFQGDVDVTGSITKGGGGFKIDHPLDPANKYLYHSFVESPDMMNIYNGNVALDGKGEATVELPEWFGALNKDFRYQLTAIGGPGPNLYIAQKVQEQRFKISGGSPGLEVSWQVTGIRQDAWANAHRIPVEELKSGPEHGYYIHPELYGAEEDRGIDSARRAQIMKQVETIREQQEKLPAAGNAPMNQVE